MGKSPPPGDGRSSPACASTNTPVPYVALTRPGRTQPAPASAACWSTHRARNGSGTAHEGCRRVPRSPAVSRIAGSTLRGTPNSSSSLGSQSGAPSCVRDAVDGSVANSAPSLSHRNESTVPMRSAPASSARPTASSFSSSQAIFPAEKYGSSGIPLRSATSSARPSSRKRSRISCERLSCQVTIGVSGRPVSASHASTDSPWWSRPHASIGPGACSRTSATAPTTASSTASGSCSTHPGRGCASGFSRRASTTVLRSAS